MRSRCWIARSLGGDRIQRAFESPVTLGMVTGLVVGKIVGITAFAWLAVRVGAARLPPRLDHVQILAAAVVAGLLGIAAAALTSRHGERSRS